MAPTSPTHFSCDSSHSLPSSTITPAPPKPFASILVEGTPVLALLDTGSDISIISDDFRMQVPSLRKKPITKQFLNTQSVTGQRMDTLGTIPITLTIGSFTTSLTVQVVRGVNRQFLLGWDFFCSHKAKIDIEHAMLTLANHSCPLVSFPRDSPICCNVHVSSPVTIPSLSESHISVTLKSPTLGYTPDAYTGIF